MDAMPAIEQKPRVNRLWPPVVACVESSTQYMKRLTVATVSHVLYSRRFLNDGHFEDESLDYLRLKILKDCDRDDDPFDVQHFNGCQHCKLRALFEAIDHKKLDWLIVWSSLAQGNSWDEGYTFRYNYDKNQFNISLAMNRNEENNNNEEVSVLSDQIRVLDMRQSMERMIRSLELKCKSLPSLPSDAWMKMTINTLDNFAVRGFTHPRTRYPSDRDVLSVGIDGHNDRLSSGEQPFIKKDVKNEVKPQIKNEPECQISIKNERE